MKIRMACARRQRSSRIGYELYRGNGSGFFNFWIGNPNHHRWYAFSIHIYWKTK